MRVAGRSRRPAFGDVHSRRSVGPSPIAATRTGVALKRAGIAIDAWKLDVFKRRLTEAGYAHRVRPGVTADTLIISVPYTDQAALQKIVQAAVNECGGMRTTVMHNGPLH